MKGDSSHLTTILSGLAHRIHPKLGDLYDWAPSYWNYALVGGLGILVNWTSFWLLGMSNWAWWAGVFIAWNFNYVLSKLWVFKNEKKTIDQKEAAVPHQRRKESGERLPQARSGQHRKGRIETRQIAEAEIEN